MTVRDPQTEPEPEAQAPTPDPATPATLATEPLTPEPAVAPCPRCGTSLREDQDWCLNCGAAATSRIAAPAGWRAPLAVVAAVLALAFAGLLIAFLAVSDDSDELTRLAAQEAAQPAETTPAPAAPAATPSVTPAPATPGAGQTVPPATAGDDAGALPGLDSLPEAEDGGASSDDGATDDDAGGSSEVGTWPSGRSAFTVVLLSSPSRAGADRRARELAGAGTDVGVLDSDEFTSLRRGYFVVFSGQYDSRDDAEDALRSLSGDAPGAYVRRVTPR